MVGKEPLTKRRFIDMLQMLSEDMQKDLLYDRSPLPSIPQVIMLPDEGLVVLDTDEKVRKALSFKYTQLERAKSLSKLFFWLTKPNRLQTLHFTTQVYNIDKRTYTKILKDIWISTEFPHQMPIPKLVTMFLHTDADVLMSKDEKYIYNNLPETVRVFRGVQDKRAKVRGLSWTTEYKVANWFATRWKDKGSALYQAEIKRKHIFMYTNARNEYECVVNPRHLQNVRVAVDKA